MQTAPEAVGNSKQLQSLQNCSSLLLTLFPCDESFIE